METATITERREYDADGVTWYLECGEHTYARRVDILAGVDNYGADRDGNRGERRTFIEIDNTEDDAPAADSPDRDEWDNLVPDEDSLLSDWASNYEGDR